jgi:hypothetical protein
VSHRWGGTCEPLASVDVASLVDWITTIDFMEWPQQRQRYGQGLRPAMVSDLAWHGFGKRTDALVAGLMAGFPGQGAFQRMLSVVMPGHEIKPHVDLQGSQWHCRVHVPLTTNSRSLFIVGGTEHGLEVGMAYKVNTEVVHSVTNDGPTPRIHFMFDVVRRDG